MAMIRVPNRFIAPGLAILSLGFAAFAYLRYMVANEFLTLFVLISLPLVWTFLSEAPKRIEGSLLFYGLIFSFWYRALKPVIYSTFLWVIIVPALALVYLFLANPKAHRMVLRIGLDKAVAAYLAYGAFMTCLGMALGKAPDDVIQTFVHAYLPGALYFIARLYTEYSEERGSKVLNLVWLICLIVVLDGAIEYYVLEELRMYKLIPWTAKNTDDVLTGMAANFLAQNPMIPFRNISILASEKVLAMVVSVFACLNAGFLLQNHGPASRGPNRSWFQKSNFATAAFFLSLLSLSILLASYATTVALFVTLFVLAMFIRTGKLQVIMGFTLFMGVTLFLLKDYLIALYAYKFTAGAIADGRSAAEHTFSIKSVFDIYAASPLSIFLGSGILEAGSVRGGSGTELRLLVYPVYYGIGWAFIIYRIVVELYRYCKFLIGYREGKDPVNPVGLAGMGFFIIYFTDIHYPAFDRHGPFELFFVMAGLFASLYETKRSKPAAA